VKKNIVKNGQNKNVKKRFVLGFDVFAFFGGAQPRKKKKRVGLPRFETRVYHFDFGNFFGGWGSTF